MKNNRSTLDVFDRMPVPVMIVLALVLALAGIPACALARIALIVIGGG